jgi:hypothetical protein
MGNDKEFEKRPEFRDVGSGVQRTGFSQLSGKKPGKSSQGQNAGPKSKAASKKKKRLRD